MRTLKEAGLPATYKNTLGTYVCNLPFFGELDTATMRAIAYDINLELAGDLEQEYLERADAIRESGYEEEFPGTADREEITWIVGG